MTHLYIIVNGISLGCDMNQRQQKNHININWKSLEELQNRRELGQEGQEKHSQMKGKVSSESMKSRTKIRNGCIWQRQ